MDFFEELTNPNLTSSSGQQHLEIVVSWWQHVRPDAQLRLPKVLSIGDAKSLYDHLHTETSGGANDRRTAIDIQIIRSSMEAQGATVRWLDRDGVYADAMTKRNGNVPLLQILMRTGRICITEEAAILERHQLQPSSRSSSSKTRVDPAAQSNDTQSKSETRWSGNTRYVNEAQNQKKIFGELSTSVSIHRLCWFCIFSARHLPCCFCDDSSPCSVFSFHLLCSVAILSPGP